MDLHDKKNNLSVKTANVSSFWFSTYIPLAGNFIHYIPTAALPATLIATKSVSSSTHFYKKTAST